jgi:hypothetical protein
MCNLVGLGLNHRQLLVEIMLLRGFVYHENTKTTRTKRITEAKLERNGIEPLWGLL